MKHSRAGSTVPRTKTLWAGTRGYKLRFALTFDRVAANGLDDCSRGPKLMEFQPRYTLPFSLESHFSATRVAVRSGARSFVLILADGESSPRRNATLPRTPTCATALRELPQGSLRAEPSHVPYPSHATTHTRDSLPHVQVHPPAKLNFN